MKLSVLITGGAGFIGTPVARKLLSADHEVSILDNFGPQIHGDNSELPADLRDSLSDHPKPANEYHLKTGQREQRLGH